MTDPHADLVRQARAGSDAAGATLFDLAWPDALRMARGVLGFTAFAEDVAQEAIISAFAQLPRFDGRRPFLVWLRRIVLNRARNSLRDNRRLVGLDPDTVAPPVDPPSGSGALWRAVAGLPPERREVVALRFALGLSLQEIAEVMEVPLGTAKSRLSRAMTDLRGALEGVPHEH
ncbi:MAG: RNA polymerase sigma factor [Thermoleophilia bacterium]